MPGLDPGIHAFAERRQDVDRRDKPGDDGTRLFKRRVRYSPVAIALRLPFG